MSVLAFWVARFARPLPQLLIRRENRVFNTHNAAERINLFFPFNHLFEDGPKWGERVRGLGRGEVTNMVGAGFKIIASTSFSRNRSSGVGEKGKYTLIETPIVSFLVQLLE